MTSSKRDASIRVYLSPEVKEEFKASCFHRSLNMSDVTSGLIEDWLRQNPPPTSPAHPENIAQLVQNNYFVLLKDGKIKPENLQVIAEGGKPTKADLYRISSVLTKISQEQLFAMWEREFPDDNPQALRKEPNGATH